MQEKFMIKTIKADFLLVTFYKPNTLVVFHSRRNISINLYIIFYNTLEIQNMHTNISLIFHSLYNLLLAERITNNDILCVRN